MFIESIKDKTIGELVDACPAPSTYLNTDSYSHRDIHYASIHSSSLDALSFNLRRDFYDFALKEEGFLNLPILAVTYDEEIGGIIDVVEKIFNYGDSSMYKCIYFDYYDGCFETTNHSFLPTDYFSPKDYDDEVFPCTGTTIRDLYLEVKEYFED